MLSGAGFHTAWASNGLMHRSEMMAYSITSSARASNEPTFADAILDRLVHGAHKLHLEGESMRKRTAVSTDKIASGKKKIDGA